MQEFVHIGVVQAGGVEHGLGGTLGLGLGDPLADAIEFLRHGRSEAGRDVVGTPAWPIRVAPVAPASDPACERPSAMPRVVRVGGHRLSAADVFHECTQLPDVGRFADHLLARDASGSPHAHPVEEMGCHRIQHAQLPVASPDPGIEMEERRRTERAVDPAGSYIREAEVRLHRTVYLG